MRFSDSNTNNKDKEYKEFMQKLKKSNPDFYENLQKNIGAKKQFKEHYSDYNNGKKGGSKKPRIPVVSDLFESLDDNLKQSFGTYKPIYGILKLAVILSSPAFLELYVLYKVSPYLLQATAAALSSEKAKVVYKKSAKLVGKLAYNTIKYSGKALYEGVKFTAKQGSKAFSFIKNKFKEKQAKISKINQQIDVTMSEEIENNDIVLNNTYRKNNEIEDSFEDEEVKNQQIFEKEHVNAESIYLDRLTISGDCDVVFTIDLNNNIYQQFVFNGEGYQKVKISESDYNKFKADVNSKNSDKKIENENEDTMSL